jgi:hypothetical protein
MAPRLPNQASTNSPGCSSLVWGVFVVAGLVAAAQTFPFLESVLDGRWRRLWALVPIVLSIVGLLGLLSGWRQRRRAPVRLPDTPWLPAFQLAPGQSLAVALERTGASSLASQALMVVVWNGAVAFTARMFWSDVRRGAIIALLVLSAFGIMGVWTLFVFVRECLVSLRVPETRVELSRVALRPGDAFEVMVSQGGWFHLTEIRVRLVCEEEVEYEEGTNTRTERVVVADAMLERQTDVDVGGGRPWSVRLRASLSEDAMHSFRSHHNCVTWKLIVAGALRAWPDFEREYVLPVVPHGLEAAIQQALAEGS